MSTSTKARPSTGALTTKSQPASKATVAGGKNTASAKGSTKPGTSAPSKGATAPTQRPLMGKFMFGMLIYLLGAQVVQYLLIFADARFHLHLATTKLFTLPLFGAVTPLALIFIAVLGVMLWALYKFNILPKNSQLAAQRAASIAAKNAGAGKNAVPSKNASAKANGAAATKGSSTTKPLATKANASIVRGATAGKPSTASRPLATAVKGQTRTDTTRPSTTGGDNDELYQRIKAQQRAQARKQRSKR